MNALAVEGCVCVSLLFGAEDQTHSGAFAKLCSTTELRSQSYRVIF
jgi:hypothetical protein